MTCNGFPQAEPLSGRGLDLGKACVWHVQRVYFVSVYWDLLSQVPVSRLDPPKSTKTLASLCRAREAQVAETLIMVFDLAKQSFPPKAERFSPSMRWDFHSARRFFVSVLTSSYLAIGVSACGAAPRKAGHSVDPSQTVESTPNSEVPTTRSNAPPEELSSPPPKPLPEKILFAKIPARGKVIGGSNPIALEAMSSTGHWVAYCQPKTGSTTMLTTSRGEAKSPTSLFVHAGDNVMEVDALLAIEAAGRFIVTLQNGAAWLLDGSNNTRWDLSSLRPDLRPDALHDHRSFVFAGGGLVVLNLADENEGSFVPLPTEPKSEEFPLLEGARRISFGSRPVWRLVSHGASLSAITVKDSATKSWPVPAPALSPRRCHTSSYSYAAFPTLSSYRPDASLEFVWLDIEKGRIKAERGGDPRSPLVAQGAPGFVTALSDAWIRRLDTGRLLLVKHGTQKQIASGRCGARILHVDVKTGLFLIACEDYTLLPPEKSSKNTSDPPKYRFDLNLVEPGFVRALQVDVARTGVDVVGSNQENLLSIRPGAEAALVDFEARKLWPLGEDVHVLATSHHTALLRRGASYSHWNKGKEAKLEVRIPPLARVLNRGPAVAVGEHMFLLGPELQSWALPAPPLALTEKGYALVPQHELREESWPPGPLVLLGPPEQISPQE
jgi:hypothetical protein